MLVLQLQDGSPYVFPTLTVMRQQIKDMTTNAGVTGVGSLLPGLQGVARQAGTEEITRMNYLKKVVTLRLTAAKATRPLPPNASSDKSLAEAQSDLTTSRKGETAIAQFMRANQRNPQIGNVGNSAAGTQAFDTVRQKSGSDALDVDRATFLDGRSRFWVTELQTSLDWMNQRIAFLNTQLGVPNVPST